MTDVALQQLGVGQFGIGVTADDLLADDGLETAVVISIFSDRRLPDGTAPNDGTNNPRGWWGDIGDPDGVPIGSLLWLLWREKVLPETVARAKEYCQQALRWMIDDGIARAVSVTAERAGLSQISIGIEIARPSGEVRRFAYLWDGQRARLQRA